jgi:hypothetical protein
LATISGALSHKGTNPIFKAVCSIPIIHIAFSGLQALEKALPAVCSWPSPEQAQDEEQEGFGPLTIPEAKAGLALGLGVPESAIEIIIKY